MLFVGQQFPKFKCHANVGPNAESLTTITNESAKEAERIHLLPEGLHLHLPDRTGPSASV